MKLLILQKLSFENPQKIPLLQIQNKFENDTKTENVLLFIMTKLEVQQYDNNNELESSFFVVHTDFSLTNLKCRIAFSFLRV